MPSLRNASAGILNDVLRKADAIFSSQVVSGNADFFTVSSLTLTLVANSADPFSYDIGGSRYDLLSNVTLSVTNNEHNFIYIDNAGALGRSALPCVYAWTAPGTPATDQHWYDLGKGQMKRWGGAAWQNVSRIFIGYVRADSGTINARYACEPVGLSPLERYELFGNGSDGFLDVSTGTSTVDNFKQYTAVVVRGGTLNHTGAVTAMTTIQVQGAFIVLSPGTVNLDGMGTSGSSGGTGAGTSGNSGGEGGRGGGGGGGSSGAGGAGGPGVQNNAFVATGGGTGGTSGGGTGGAGAAALASPGPGRIGMLIGPQGASGGGGGGNGTNAGASGGAAGGAFEIKAPVFAVGSGATMSAKGANGSNGPAINRGAGGGGGGGTFTIWCRNSFQSGTIDVSAGSGGASGGAGSGAGGNGGAGRSEIYLI